MNALHDQWTKEPIAANVQALLKGDSAPSNCRELINSYLVTSCFADANCYPGMLEGEELEEALAEDNERNLEHFGVANPAELIKALDAQYDADKLDSAVIKSGLDLLKAVYDFTDGIAIELEDVPESHPKYNPDMRRRATLESEVAKGLAHAIRITEKLFQESKKST